MQNVTRIPIQALSTVGRPGIEDLFFFMDSENANTLTSINNAGVVTTYAPQLGFFNWAGTIANADTNPNYPAATAGDAWLITTTTGKVGGANGKNVSPGDVLLAKNTNAGGNEGAVGADFTVIEGQDNLINALGADASKNKVTVGAQNSVLGDRSLAYGQGNDVHAPDSVAFGSTNTVDQDSQNCAVIGAENQTIAASQCAIIAGSQNQIDTVNHSSILSGTNQINNESFTALAQELRVTDNVKVNYKANNGATGEGALVGGTVAIANTIVAATSLIFLTRTGGVPANNGHLTVTAGEGTFTVTSDNALDTSTFYYLVINR